MTELSLPPVLTQEIENLGDIVKQTVEVLQLGTRPCVSVKVGARTRHAMPCHT